MVRGRFAARLHGCSWLQLLLAEETLMKSFKGRFRLELVMMLSSSGRRSKYYFMDR